MLVGRLAAPPEFKGNATLSFSGNTVTGAGSVVMTANAVRPTLEKYTFDITWAPITTASFSTLNGRLELSKAPTSLMTGALRIDGNPVNGGRVIAPIDGLASLAYRCEKNDLTLFLPTFLSDAQGDKLFTYGFTRTPA